MRAKALRTHGYKHYSEHELALLARLKAAGKTPQEVADALHRDLSSVARRFKRLDSRDHVNPVGRPVALTTVQTDRLVARAEKMIEDADCQYHVTAAMVRAACKIKCTDRAECAAQPRRAFSPVPREASANQPGHQ